MQTIVKCPSGLTGEVRNLKGREAEVLSDRASVRSGAAIDQLLSNCWLRTDDSSIYTFPSGKPEWLKVYQCDRFYTLLQLRVATFGDKYAFPVKCKDCEERFEWEMSISKLAFKSLPDTVREQLRLGKNDFAAKLPGSERCVHFKLLTGRDERDGAARLKQLVASAGQGRRGKLLLSLSLKINSIDGIEPRPPRDDEEDPKVEFLREMDLPDLTGLADAMEAVDGGVETTIEIQCPECELDQEVDVPFDGAFWSPKAKKKAAAT